MAPPPEPADVGLVAALPMEVEALLGAFGKVRKFQGPRHKVIEGVCGGKVVALVLVGMGREAARRGTRLLLDGHRPRWIISAGFGGALDPSLRRNDVVLPTEVLDDDGRSFALGVGVPGDAKGFRAGRLATVDKILRTAAEKAELRARTGADVVDMETAGVAEVCVDRGVRMLSIRVISDEAGVDLPPRNPEHHGPDRELSAGCGRRGDPPTTVEPQGAVGPARARDGGRRPPGGGRPGGDRAAGLTSGKPGRELLFRLRPHGQQEQVEGEGPDAIVVVLRATCPKFRRDQVAATLEPGENAT